MEGPAKAEGPDEAKKAREKAVYYLQFSGKTEQELRKKLAEQEFSPASVDSAIEFVKKYRYLDDEDYARRFVEKNGTKKSRKQMITVMRIAIGAKAPIWMICSSRPLKWPLKTDRHPPACCREGSGLDTPGPGG